MTGVLEIAGRRQCVGLDSAGSSEHVRSEKVAETFSGAPLDSVIELIE